MNKITVILTCCGRFDLLHRTLRTFFLMNTYPIKKFVIYEDKGQSNYTQSDFDFVHIIQREFPQTKWIQPAERVGQILALDRLMLEVDTEYYFNLEEDWIFLKEGFMESSVDLLEKYDMCNQVQIRGKDNINGHPSFFHDGILRLQKSYAGRWNGWGFNPSVRRTSDYDAIGSYSQHTTFNPNRPWESEIAIGNLYNEMGYFTAVLPDTYISHIGERRGIRK